MTVIIARLSHRRGNKERFGITNCKKGGPRASGWGATHPRTGKDRTRQEEGKPYACAGSSSSDDARLMRTSPPITSLRSMSNADRCLRTN
jgi:hypothetical protein